MKKLNALLAGFLMLWAAGIAAELQPGASVPSSPLVSWAPTEPRWGEMVVFTYNPKAPKAALAPGDEIFLLFGFPPRTELHRVRLEREGDVLRGRVVVERGAGFVSAYVISRHGWDSKAGVGIMVFRPDGKAAPGAWQQKMLHDFSAETYKDSFDKERALYSDNYAVYRDKWMIESMVKKAEHKAIVEKEVGELEKRLARKESVSLLYALANGNWLIGREEAGRKHLRRMTEIAPGDSLTAAALGNYNYQAFSQQWKGEGPEEVRKLALGLFERDPGAAVMRQQYEGVAHDERLSLKTARAVCEAWIAAEPDNPTPYYELGRAEKSKGGDLTSAEAAAAKAVELGLAGNFRFHGDIGGSLTQFRLPTLYAMLAEIKRDLGKYAEALAAVKAARTMTKETRTDHAGIEASIWAALGAHAKAESCWLEARNLGHKDAEKELRAIYEKRRGTAEGFEDYLAEKVKGQGGAQGAGAGGTGGAAAAPADMGPSGRRPAPELAFKALDGREARLSDLKGKVVVLNFWYIGCAPCRVEMPGLNKLVDTYKGKDVVFLAFALDEAAAIREFLKAASFRYEIVAKGGEAAKLFEVSVYPTHILIDKTGAVAYFLTGGSPERHEQLAPLIDRLLL